MIHILAKDELLNQLARSSVLLAFDFDGTLAPIVEDRDRAQMRSKTAALFRQLCQEFPVAVISGRSKADVGTRLQGAHVKYVVGNHGLEAGGELGAFEEEVRLVAPQLADALRGLQGVDIENKLYSFAVHYRRARDKHATQVYIEAVVANLPIQMRLVHGISVVNIVPANAPHKGDALLKLQDQEGLATALYVGDDVTDEDVFRIEQPGRLVGVRIGKSSKSSAGFFIENQDEIDVLLERLLMFCKEKTHRA
jgi:trehalose 6-phosphate phosphatase